MSCASSTGWTLRSHGLNSRRAGLCLLALTLSGWLHVIWNGEPRFVLIDDRGIAVRVVIDPELARALGGVRSLDRQRVVIAGELVAGNADVIRATAIELERETP
jgi:hypothetical protein